VRRKAERHWRKAGLKPGTPHEARHTFASLLVAPGVNFKEISQYMGHSGIEITLDRYSHLLEGSEQRTAERVGRFLARASS
jgi:integrase